MLNPVLRHGRMVVLAYGIGLAGIFLAVGAEKGFGLTPNSPEVKEAVEKATVFLESNPAADHDERLGAQALVGYTLLIYGADKSHVKVTAAAAKLQAALGALDSAKLDASKWDIYSTGLSIIFLVKLDPKKYHSEIECLLASLRQRQKPHGGWGYPVGGYVESGDTSMTQYGVLGSWTATQAGFNVPLQSIESVAGWLLKTQDPGGGFGYQGNIGAINALVPQNEIRPSMTAAASGSLYICASLLGLIEKKDKDEKLPSALKEIKGKEKEAAKNRVKSRIDPRRCAKREDRAKKWLADNGKPENIKIFAYYYLYALERCMTFRDLYEHRSEKEPAWYNEAAEFLLKYQNKDGSWDMVGDPCGVVPNTTFAALFLMRSTQKAITVATVYGTGTMIGGRGIPKNTDRIELRNGNIVSRPLLGPAEKLLAALDKPDGRDFDNSVDLLAQLPADEVEKLAAKYGDKIRRLVGSKSPEARLAAVLALAKTRDLDNVETLIYALTDPDYRVVRAANDGLLRIRRIPAVVVLPDNFSEEDRRLLVEKWKAWYQTIRPSAEVKY